VILFRLLTKTQFWVKLTAPGAEHRDQGYTTSFGFEQHLGKEGKAMSDLRPSGWATIGDARLFVVTEGDFVSQGEKIKVLKVDGNRVVVRKINSNSEESKS